jgi:hypothetical protein
MQMMQANQLDEQALLDEKEKVKMQHKLNFSQSNVYGGFNSRFTNQPKITYFGLDELPKKVLDQNMESFENINVLANLKRDESDPKQEQLKVMEAAQVEQFNRFKELQKEYSKSFNYKLYNQELRVNCRACYLPFEARMDQETFELFLLNSNPKDVVLLGFSNQSLEKTKNFCN